MAIWPLNGVVQLLIFVYNFISLAYLIEAQILYPPSVQVSTSWTVPSPMGADRIILFNGKPSARLALNKRVGFACGFYSRSTQANSFFFAVGTALEDLASGEDRVYLDKVVWLANRNKPVGQNAKLQLLPDGNLVLEDADGSFVWSTDTANKAVAGMKMMDTGNLVLHDIHNKTIWQSFDHPTDTLLLGQKLVAGKNMVASVSETIMSEGNFSFFVTFKGLFAFYQVNVPQMYLNFDFSDEVSQGNVPYHFIDKVGRIELNYRNDVGVFILSVFSTDGVEFGFHSTTLPAYTNTTVSRVKFDPDGHLRLYHDQYESADEYQPVDLLETQLDKCDYPTVCGNYGLCSYGQCTCPAGFAHDRDSGTEFSCSEINPGPTICENPQSQFLLSLEDTYYFNYVDKEAAVLKETDVETCKQACMKNCSCKAALFKFLDIDKIFGNCYLPSPVLSFITDGKGKYDYNSSAFIKISNKGESGGRSDAIPKYEGSGTGRGSSASAIRTEIIAGFTIGTFLLMCLIVGFWIVILRNKGDGEEGMEDCLDQLSGMPKRFAYIELKVATWEFQKSLEKVGLDQFLKEF